MKDRYLFPAVLKYEEDVILVSFPDLEGCITYGENDEHAIASAKEALEGYLFVLERDRIDIPAPTLIKDIKLGQLETVILVDVWMPLVRDQEANRSVKKTLTLPKWLNDAAERNNVNFSHLLQASLKQYLGIAESSIDNRS